MNKRALAGFLVMLFCATHAYANDPVTDPKQNNGIIPASAPVNGTVKSADTAWKQPSDDASLKAEATAMQGTSKAADLSALTPAPAAIPASGRIPPATLKETIIFLYRDVLNKEPTAASVQHWLDQYSKGASLADICQYFFASEEFSKLSNPEKVTAVYRLILGKNPDAGGLKFWVAQYEKSGSLTTLVKSFLSTKEFTGSSAGFRDYITKTLGISEKSMAEVETLRGVYRELLGRSPDIRGLKFWLEKYRSGMSLEKVRFEFLVSAEFATKPLETKLSLLYPMVLGKAIDPAKLKALCAQYTQSTPVVQIIRGLVASDDFKAMSFQDKLTVLMKAPGKAVDSSLGFKLQTLYQMVIGKQVSSTQLTALMAKYTTQTSTTQIVYDLLNSQEFRSRPLAEQLSLLPKAPGTYGNDMTKATSFSSSDKILATYYFYWYKADSLDPATLGDTPVDLKNVSYESVAWHKKQLKDMMDAGINLILPVYWGKPGFTDSWSNKGLKALVQAWTELKNEGYEPPKIGMFFDNSSLAEPNMLGAQTSSDLTNRANQLLFYGAVRDFFSFIPPGAMAQIDNKPVVWLYAANPNGRGAIKYGQENFSFLDQAFARDFKGKNPYVVAENSWKGSYFENKYVWGSSLHGFAAPSNIASVGPGFDERHLINDPKRSARFQDREGGNFYRSQWDKALASKANIVVIETWNEYFESADIAESVEYGRQYIDITKEYAHLFFGG